MSDDLAFATRVLSDAFLGRFSLTFLEQGRLAMACKRIFADPTQRLALFDDIMQRCSANPELAQRMRRALTDLADPYADKP